MKTKGEKSKFLVMALIVSFMIMQPLYGKKVEATVAINGTIFFMEEPRSDFQETAQMILCFTFFPFCLLEEKNEQGSVSRQDLLNNGYPEEEIAVIFHDQNQLIQNLKAKNLKIEITEKDTAATLQSDLREIHPAVSDTYVRFFLDYNGY